MPYPNRMNLTVTIGGTDRTSYIVPATLEIRSVLTRRIDTAKFRLEEASAIEPTEWDEVIIKDGTTKIFAGYILRKTQVDGPSVDLNFDIACGDYAALLDKVIVKAEYEDKTDAFILNDLFTTYLPEINATTNVTAIKTHTKVRFNRDTLREAVDALADFAGGDWYIDYDKNLHYFPSEDSAAPFSLSESPDLVSTFPFEDLRKDTDGSGVVNRVEVVGGNYLSDDQTIYLQGTGQDTRVQLPFKMRGPAAGGGIVVDRNDGTEGSPSWTSMTVKTGYIDTLGGSTEVLHYFQEKVLEQQSSWPNLPNAVRVQGRFEIPLRTRVQNAESQSFYGRIFDDVINDPDITDKNTAKLAGKGLMAKYALGRVAVSLKTREPGLLAGMTLTVDSPTHGISSQEFLVQEVTAKVGVNGYSSFDVDLGVSDPDLIDVIVKLARSAKSKPLWREDEVLDELLETFEELDFTEGTPTVTSDSEPYHWGPGGANPLDWGFGVWGVEAPSIGSPTTQKSSSGSTVTWNHTTAHGGMRALLVACGFRASSVSSVTYNGVALTEINSISSGDGRSSLWILLNPPEGTFEVKVTGAADMQDFVGFSFSCTGVDQTTPTENVGSNVANPATSIDVTTTVDDGDLWINASFSYPAGAGNPLVYDGTGTKIADDTGPANNIGYGVAKGEGDGSAETEQWSGAQSHWRGINQFSLRGART